MKICPACSTEYSAERTHCERDGVMLVALAAGASGRPEDLVGRTVDGRYLVEAIIGKGGMGTVYACRHIVVGKPFAMKVLRSGIEQTEGVLQRFIREAQTANSVRSRHIVEMTDFGQLPSGQFYVTMDLLQGMDLGKALKRGLSPAELFHVFIQTAEVLELTHQRGIVHRDLKPDNIFLVREDDDPLFVKLLDFGIAKALHAGPSNLTDTGIILGTPYYMSPEQARGEGIDHRTDIYSLGVIMYRAFTGKLPFIADSAMGVLTRHLTERPDPPSRLAGIDPLTERVILCCLEKKPADRFGSMAAVAGALRSIRGGERSVYGMPNDPTTRDGGVYGPPPSISGAVHAYTSGAHGPISSGAHGPVSSGAHGPVSASMLGSGSGPMVTPVSPYAPPPPPSHPYAASPVSQPFSASGGHPFAPASQGFAPASQGFAPPPSHAIAGPPSDGRAPQSVHQPLSQAYTSNELPGPQGEQTGRGLAASHAMRRELPRRRWPLVVGAFAMLAVGSALAATIEMLARSPASTTAAGPSAPVSSIAPAVPTAPAGVTVEPSTSATDAPTTTAAAPSSAPSASTTATATAAPSATARPSGGSSRQGGGGSVPPKPQPSATASVRRPAEIRSPFD